MARKSNFLNMKFWGKCWFEIFWRKKLWFSNTVQVHKKAFFFLKTFKAFVFSWLPKSSYPFIILAKKHEFSIFCQGFLFSPKNTEELEKILNTNINCLVFSLPNRVPMPVVKQILSKFSSNSKQFPALFPSETQKRSWRQEQSEWEESSRWVGWCQDG